MNLEANTDRYGNPVHLTSDKLRHILDLIDGYMNNGWYEIHKIWQEDVTSSDGRIDIEIIRLNENNEMIMQKILIIDDELLDAMAFHKRVQERRNKLCLGKLSTLT